MTRFDQRNQNIGGNQINIGGDLLIDFREITQESEIPLELMKVIAALSEAERKGIISAEMSTQLKRHVQESIGEAQKPNPNAKNIIENLNGAKTLIEGIASAGGLVKVLIEASEMVRRFFG
jgi:hypothetical protein